MSKLNITRDNLYCVAVGTALTGYGGSVASDIVLSAPNVMQQFNIAGGAAVAAFGAYCAYHGAREILGYSPR